MNSASQCKKTKTVPVNVPTDKLQFKTVPADARRQKQYQPTQKDKTWTVAQLRYAFEVPIYIEMTFLCCAGTSKYGIEQGGVLAPFFTTDEPGDDKLVVEDNWGVHFGLDVFYLSKIFLGEDALIKLDGFLWDFWKESLKMCIDMKSRTRPIRTREKLSTK